MPALCMGWRCSGARCNISVPLTIFLSPGLQTLKFPLEACSWQDLAQFGSAMVMKEPLSLF